MFGGLLLTETFVLKDQKTKARRKANKLIKKYKFKRFLKGTINYYKREVR